MKKVRLEPLGENVTLPTGRRLLDALLSRNLKVPMSCGGRGICSTCHVHICSGMEQLSPISSKERRTLSIVVNATPESRLACQASVYGDGVEVRVPEGMYIERADDLLSLLGTRATQNILHPITGEILISAGKLITRTLLEKSRHVDEDVQRMRQSITDTTSTGTGSNLLDSLTRSSFTGSGAGLPSRSSNTTQFLLRTAVEWSPDNRDTSTSPGATTPPASASMPSGSPNAQAAPHAPSASPSRSPSFEPPAATPASHSPRLDPPPTHSAPSGKGHIQENPLPVTVHLPNMVPEAPRVAAHAPHLQSSSSNSRQEIKPGMQLNRYLILECVGRGGSGIVYRGLHTTLKTAIAIKFLKSHYNDVSAHERFAREAQLLAQLSHIHIVRVLDYEDDPVRPYVVMEYVEGLSAAELIRQSGRLHWPRALQITLDAARGLQAAFKLNIIHRDIKPGNILVARDGIGKLVDFGLATTLQPESDQSDQADNKEPIQGTIGYIAPEMLAHGNSDHRSDIYSLGATLFHLIAGRLPFEGRSVSQVMVKHLQAPVPVLHELVTDVPPQLSIIIQRMMAKDSLRRYQDYHDLIHDLQQLIPTSVASATV